MIHEDQDIIDMYLKSLDTRPMTHGDFNESSNFVQSMHKLLNATPNAKKLTSAQARGLKMIIEKLSRILYGDYGFHDHWIDIEGYAKLINRSMNDK